MNNKKYTFLSGGGEMGELIRGYDWEATSLGPIDSWTSCLRSMVSMMLTSKLPMVIFWGKELITFYNDTFRPTLGNSGKHPTSLGQRGEVSWAECWPVIGPMIHDTMAGGDQVSFGDHTPPRWREGEMHHEYGAYNFTPLRDETEHIAGLLLTFTETPKTAENYQEIAETTKPQETIKLAKAIEELQQSNEKLEEANRKLVHSNEELSQYAYAASHDLQEPLRKITLFSSRLDSYQELPGDLKDTMSKIRSSTERMSLLIKGLLEFSQLLDSEKMIRPVNLQEVIEDILKDFEISIYEKNAQIRLGQLPVVEGVSLQLNQLFYNLIGNSLKFSRTGVDPLIEIDASIASADFMRSRMSKYDPNQMYHIINVRDNGIGFDPQYVQQIFEVFKRLHNRTEFAGSGIGLALCRRIAENHHGKIFADATPGEGAAFQIILPAKQS